MFVQSLVAASLMLLAPKGAVQTSGNNPITGESPAEFAKRTEWFRNAKFGMFIHWGIYSVPADSTDLKGNKGAGEWYMTNKQAQIADYEKFAGQFNPVNFDARKWVSTAKSAGMKYIVITSKHHDGFDMFDSAVSDYTVVKSTPWKHDPMKDLAAECKRQGLKFCFYHSIMDWHQKDYVPKRSWYADQGANADFERYVTYLKAQLKELLTQYGPIGILWFDGQWENTWNQARGADLYKYVRSLQPNTIVNNRVDDGNGDDYGTPEQEIPTKGFADNRLWETCMTLNDTWGYAKNDDNWKTSEILIHNLIDIASKGGNYLLNVGPTNLGEFTPETMDRLQTMGAWMKKYSASIYGTTASPFGKLSFDGRCTRKGNKLFLQVFKWPEDGRIVLGGLKTEPSRAKELSTGETVVVSKSTSGDQAAWAIQKPNAIDPYATVVELDFRSAPEVVQVETAVTPAANGDLGLMPGDADLVGGAGVETRGGQPNIGFWMSLEDKATWTVKAPAAGAYTVEVEYACPATEAGSEFAISDGSESVHATVSDTGDWGNFKVDTLAGKLNLPSGKSKVVLSAVTLKHGALMNIRRITLHPASTVRSGRSSS